MARMHADKIRLIGSVSATISGIRGEMLGKDRRCNPKPKPQNPKPSPPCPPAGLGVLRVKLHFLASFSDGNSGITYFRFLALTEISLVLVSTHENKQAGGSGGAMDQDPGGL